MANNIEIKMRDGYYAPSTVLWLLAEELTIRQAALLLINEDPERWPLAEYPMGDQCRPLGYEASRQVLVSALNSEVIRGRTTWRTVTKTDPDGIESWQESIEGEVCGDRSTINMDSLRSWLAAKNVTIEQFAGLAPTSEDFLDRELVAYSPKLAATVAAWRHVSKNLKTGISVKQQLMNWLKENSPRYWPDGLDPKVTDTFIKEAARIANWDVDGGRPSTFLEKREKNSSRRSMRDYELSPANEKPSQGDYSDDLDDEIPF